MNRPLDTFLARLKNVNPYGNGYRAKCPAKDHRTPTPLSINVSEDGNVLVKCFSGCDTLSVVHAVGMEMADLFDRPLNPSAEDLKVFRTESRYAKWMAALSALEHESMVVLVASEQIAEGKPLALKDRVRLEQAHDRIEDARMVLNV